MPSKVVPPTPEELRAFSLGKCDPARADEIESYLSDAGDCSSILTTAPEDELLRHLRGVGDLPSDRSPLAPATLPSLAGPAESADTASLAELAEPLELGAEAAGLKDHPRYRLIRKLGQGGMGAVYLAEHRLMRRQVAIKLIRSRFLGNPQFVDRFRREMQAAASLSHPHIVTAHDAEEAAGTHFLVMEFVDGEPLDSWLAQSSARGEKLPVPEACAYVRQAALGLQVAHEKGMVHRDIKPHNLMRTREGAVKILDFGLARVIREAVQGPGELITAEGTVMGTADYMAPEQGRDSHRADIRADIYSLGCSLYHLLSGSVPFPQGTTIVKILKHTMARPEPLSSFRQDLPVGLVQIVEKMMAKKPEDRYQTPGEVATALEPFCIAGFAEKGDAPRPIGNLPSGSYDAASRDFPSWRRGITWKLMFAIPVIGALAMLLLALLLLRLGV